MDDAGQHPFAVAATHPDRTAAVMADGSAPLTFGELADGARRLAQVLHDHGLRPGDHLAVLLENRSEFFVTIWAGLSSGLYVTPVNWHLTADEAAFIAIDCGAKALVSSTTLGDLAADTAAQCEDLAVALAVGGDLTGPTVDGLAGFVSFEHALSTVRPAAERADDDRFDECAGQWMFYSSGTTGRPKGIMPGPVGAELGRPQPFCAMLTHLFGMSEESRYLSPAPLYHAAPAGWTSGAQCLGASVVVMESFDPEGLLAAVESHRITHLQVVPTHLVRLLKLPDEVRRSFDTSSLEVVVHAAAPCPVEVKRSAMDWLGPILYEYYAGSEGNGFCVIGPTEWLEHPGSVGRSLQGAVHVTKAEGDEVPPGTDGQIWFESSRRWEYHGDPAKTASAWDTERGWSTLGDVGHVDAEGYVYLTDRVSNMIISGGVNIYPREVEDLLIAHEAVFDVAVVGTPDAEMGELVTAFVQLVPGAATSADDLPAELVEYCRAHLAHFKCPREVRLVDELPRLPTGKLLKRLLQ
jgi:acyl-CoA synthetase (AMP-forming)/AMP-acid ligase II